MSYNTFPVIQQDPQQFVSMIEGIGRVLRIGESIEL